MTDGAWEYKFHRASDLPERLTRLGLTVDEHPEGAPLMIGVYCEEGSHEGDPWLVGAFDLALAGLAAIPEARWNFLPRYPLGGNASVRLENAIDQNVFGSRQLPHERDALFNDPDFLREEVRLRFVLKCGLCGMSVILRRETLVQVGALLENAGLREVSLRLLAGAVQRLTA